MHRQSRWTSKMMAGRWIPALVAFATITAVVSSTQAQQVVVQGQAPPPPQPQPYYAPQPQPVYAQPAYPPPAQPARPAQPRTVTRPNLGLIVSGAVLLGVGWVANIISGLPAGDDPFDSGSEPEWDAFRLTSIIPVAGPWIQLGVKPTTFAQDYWAPWLIIDGLLQLAGVTMLIVGIATPRTQTTVAANEGGLQMALVPRVGPDQAGAALVGTF